MQARNRQRVSTRASGSSRLAARYWFWLLGGTVLLSLWLRWPLPAPEWSHFDEESLVLIPLGFWSGDLNPHFFNYPTLQFYLASLLYFVRFALADSGPLEQFVAYRYFVDGSDLLSLARGFGTVMAAATVAVTGFLGRLLYGAAGGLLAALFLALMPLSVRFAHLANTDTPAVLWVGLALVFAVRMRQRGTSVDALAAGLFVGLAGATKYPAALAAVPVAAAALLRTPSLRQPGIWCAGAAAVLAFCAASPYVWLDAAAFWSDFSEMGRDHLIPDAAAERPLFFHLRYTLRFGLGLGGAALLFLALARKPGGLSRDEVVLLSGLGAFAILLAAAGSVFMRYALPLTPIVSVLMVRPLLRLRRSPALLAGALAVLLAEPAWTSLRTRALLSGSDTREQAVSWMENHFPDRRRLVHLPDKCGNIQVLTPHRVLVRQTHFLRSFGEDRLMAAYDWLRRRHGLPRLYLEPDPASVLDRARQEPAAGPGVILLDYLHPLCADAEVPPKAAELVPSASWRQTFSPGIGVAAADFDPMDWYFLPLSGFAGLEQTGPTIRLGTLGSATEVPEPGAATLFDVLLNARIGHLAMRDSDWDQAVQAFERALRVPQLSDLLPDAYACRLLCNAGVAHGQLGAHDRTRPFWSQAVDLVPDDPEYYNDLAVACAGSGRIGEAIEVWERLLVLAPDHPTACFNLAKALYNTGQYHRAYEVALKGLGPDHPFAASVRRFLGRDE
ncbi:MAG: tetratricopeptide repeat protein [Gemmatimonadetes bacterium]|nr:tetratricopeptide repeat protein [Gemmatimonadota bacterium]